MYVPVAYTLKKGKDSCTKKLANCSGRLNTCNWTYRNCIKGEEYKSPLEWQVPSRLENILKIFPSEFIP